MIRSSTCFLFDMYLLSFVRRAYQHMVHNYTKNKNTYIMSETAVFLSYLLFVSRHILFFIIDSGNNNGYIP